jgi:type IV pilus assembly protein PilP
MKHLSLNSCLSGLMALLLLVGCTSSQEELSQWMEQQQREVKPSVTPLSAPKKFNPQAYLSSSGVDPYSNQKLTVSLKQESRQVSSLLTGEVNRRKEPLEAFPIDSMSMVGSVIKAGKPNALLKVDNLLYQVRAGEYLGQNYGRIKDITETKITFREVVQDATGEWIERMGSLALQENAK